MITIKSGTTAEFVIALTDSEGNEYKIFDADTLIFGVKANVNAREYILSVNIYSSDYNATQGGYLVHLTPEDTANIIFGDYVYDVGLQKANGEFYIVCPCDVFIVENTVTKKVYPC